MVTGEIEKVQADRLFATDGAYSAVRRVMQKQKRFNYSQEYIDQGYKEIILPSCPDGSWRMEKNALHIWPRMNFIILGFPNMNGSFTLTLHLPFEGYIFHVIITSNDQIQSLFKKYFPDVLPFLESGLNDYFNHPAQSMVTIKCSPWTYQKKVALLGDSCHAILPYYGQGTNAGFEDCQVIMKCIEIYPGDWWAIFQEYKKLRKPNMDVIADLCYQPFTVLTKMVSSAEFLLRSKIERKIQ